MNVVYIHFNVIFFYHLTEKIVILNGFGRSEVKKFKYVAASIFVAICCVIVIGAPKIAFAAGDNQLTVSVTDDYYSKPIDGVTITITDTATSSVVSEQITDANGRVQVTLPDGTYQVEQTKFKAGYVINHSATNVTFSGVAGGNSDHQTINIEDVHIMGRLYVSGEDIPSSRTIADVQFDIEDEFGNKIASGIQGGQSVTVPVTGSYTVIPKNYPTRFAYNSDAVMIDSVFACTPSSTNGMVPLHAVTFPYASDTRIFEQVTRATIKFPVRRGNIIVRVVDQHGNPIAGATLKATPSYNPAAGIPSPACPPFMGGFGSPDPAYLPGTETPRAMTQTPPAPGVPYTQTGELARDDDDNYLLTTGPDGTVIIPDYLVESGSTITQLTTLDGYTIDDPNPQVGEITGSNETATVTFVNRRPEPPAPEPQPEPQPEPTPEPTPEPQTQTPEKPKTPKKKKAVLPDTSDISGITSLIVGITGTLSSFAGVSMYFNKKRF